MEKRASVHYPATLLCQQDCHRRFSRSVSSYLPVHPAAAPPHELTFRWRMEALVHMYTDGAKEARMRYNQSRYIALHGVLVILYFKIRTDERLTLTEQKCRSSNGQCRPFNNIQQLLSPNYQHKGSPTAVLFSVPHLFSTSVFPP
ncbi:hypothetical protein CBL_13784 [Carabus blaptoides fortunei]